MVCLCTHAPRLLRAQCHGAGPILPLTRHPRAGHHLLSCLQRKEPVDQHGSLTRRGSSGLSSSVWHVAGLQLTRRRVVGVEGGVPVEGADAAEGALLVAAVEGLAHAAHKDGVGQRVEPQRVVEGPERAALLERQGNEVRLVQEAAHHLEARVLCGGRLARGLPQRQHLVAPEEPQHVVAEEGELPAEVAHTAGVRGHDDARHVPRKVRGEVAGEGHPRQRLGARVHGPGDDEEAAAAGNVVREAPEHELQALEAVAVGPDALGGGQEGAGAEAAHEDVDGGGRRLLVAPEDVGQALEHAGAVQVQLAEHHVHALARRGGLAGRQGPELLLRELAAEGPLRALVPLLADAPGHRGRRLQALRPEGAAAELALREREAAVREELLRDRRPQLQRVALVQVLDGPAPRGLVAAPRHEAQRELPPRVAHQ
mmetsp:Transcript_66891/g.215634  ORF Transcript_66891/g.215634 Transcript_66891/m.215634 type:complete len:427 (-) Transcript_66891:572-1852(-)